MIEQFLSEGPYIPNDGSAVSLKTFTREFTRWLDDPQLQQHWCDHHRIERALRDADYPVAHLDKHSAHVGNLSGPGARWVFKENSRKLVDEGGWLWPQDRNDAPPGTPTSSYRISKAIRPMYVNSDL